MRYETKWHVATIGAVIILIIVTQLSSMAQSEHLKGVIESNRLVAEETRELTEAIHENNRILEIIERTE